jgi:hypothetical protein
VGENLLFGEEALDLMVKVKKDNPESYLKRLSAQQSLLLNLYDRLRENTHEYKKELVFLISKLIESELTGPEYYSLLTYLLKEPLIFAISEIPGQLEQDTKTKTSKLIVKDDIANLAFTKLASFLSSGDYMIGELARIEVLNNTEINGLAKGAKSLLNEKSFKVLTTSNGWTSLEKQSIVLDRSGNTEYSYKVAKILGIKTVRHNINNELGLDTTIILGEDFETKNGK